MADNGDAVRRSVCYTIPYHLCTSLLTYLSVDGWLCAGQSTTYVAKVYTCIWTLPARPYRVRRLLRVTMSFTVYLVWRVPAPQPTYLHRYMGKYNSYTRRAGGLACLVLSCLGAPPPQKINMGVDKSLHSHTVILALLSLISLSTFMR